MTSGRIVLDALIITFALSLDTLVSGFAYGVNKIKIPIKSIIVINLVCCSVLSASLIGGSVLGKYIPSYVNLSVSVVLLFTIGLIKLLDEPIKNAIRKKNLSSTIASIYAEPEKADTDFSKSLSVQEALFLSLALSIDGFVAGFGAGLTINNFIGYLTIITLSFFTGIAFIIFGNILGKTVALKSKLDLSWLSGLILMILAIVKLF